MNNQKTWGIIITLKGNTQQTIEFVNYHFNMGVNFIILYFDNPYDDAISFLRNNEKVKCIVCDSDHWRSLSLSDPDLDQKIQGNMDHGRKILNNMGIEWAICIDSDELLFCDFGRNTKSIGSLLFLLPEYVGSAAVRSCEAVFTSNQYESTFFNSEWFKVRSWKNDLLHSFFIKLLNCHIKNITNEGFFFGHVAGKSFFRTNLDLKKVNHHRPLFFSADIKHIEADKLKLLHYDCMPYEIWKRRWGWRISGETNSTRMSKMRLKQFSIIKKNMRKGDKYLRKLYKRWFFVGCVRLFFLSMLGQMVKFDINKEVFKKPVIFNESRNR